MFKEGAHLQRIMGLESKINNVMKLELKSRKKKLYIYMGWREGWQKAKKKKRGGKGAQPLSCQCHLA